MQTADQLKLLFWTRATYEAARLGFPIAPSCEAHLRPFLEAGADRLFRDGLGTSASHVAIAEGAVASFVASMTVEAVRLGYDELHEPTFFAVAQRLCPLWPFC